MLRKCSDERRGRGRKGDIWCTVERVRCSSLGLSCLTLGQCHHLDSSAFVNPSPCQWHQSCDNCPLSPLLRCSMLTSRLTALQRLLGFPLSVQKTIPFPSRVKDSETPHLSRDLQLHIITSDLRRSSSAPRSYPPGSEFGRCDSHSETCRL